MPMSLRLPEDILRELPYIAVFYHKTSSADLLREWIVKEAGATMNKPGYIKFKAQMQKTVEGKKR